MCLRSAHEGLQRFLDIAMLVEDTVKLAGDGHFDVIPFCKAVSGAAAGIALNGADLFDGFLRRNALPDENACPTVAAVHTGAGDNEVADACEPCEGVGTRAECQSQTGDFVETAGHEGSFGIVAKAQTIADAGAQGDDVFECAAKFTARHIVVVVM